MLDPHKLQQDVSVLEDNAHTVTATPQTPHSNQEDRYKRIVHFLMTLGGHIYMIGGPVLSSPRCWLGKTNISEPVLLIDDFHDLMIIQGKSRASN